VESEKWFGSNGWYHGTWEVLAKSFSIRICSAKVMFSRELMENRTTSKTVDK